jgi:hypothetical protein
MPQPSRVTAPASERQPMRAEKVGLGRVCAADHADVALAGEVAVACVGQAQVAG